MKTMLEHTNENRLFACAIAGALSMQLAEANIHEDPECTGTSNVGGSHWGVLSLLTIQPVASFIGMVLFPSLARGVPAAETPRVGVDVRSYDWKHKYYVVGWIIVYMAYQITVAFEDMEDYDYTSETLGRDVSRYCTADKKCSDFGCDLDWHWAPNEGYKYYFYWAVVFLFPALCFRSWLFWVVATLVPHAFPTVHPSFSCFWGPLLAVGIQATTLPMWVQRQFETHCLAKKPGQSYGTLPQDEAPVLGDTKGGY